MQKGLLAAKDLESLLKEAESSGESLQQVLIKRGLFPEGDLLNILAERLRLNCVNLKSLSPDKSVIDKVPVKIASYYRFVPLSIKNRVLTIVASSPLDIKIQDEIRAQLGYDIETVLSCQADIAEGLKRYYGFAADTIEKMASSASDHEASGMEPSHEKIEDIEKLAEDASIIKLVNQIILEAWRKRATDIHIEPSRLGVALRYRIDGLLYDANVPPEIKNFLSAIISRIKIMSNLNIVERRLPQDGRAVVKAGEEVLDLRISSMPTPFGESIVIRILPTRMLFSLEKLGLSRRDLQIFEQLIQKPHGIIFVTGPTGSGKTTTLYTCLSKINTRVRKIITIEDPIEYEMPGIIQIQVMPEIGLDFARGLRSILRHDPDVIMVGEVRDLETAEIAIRVALTGHLVFSTLHTNDAASGITRLADIGVEPYLIASSIEAFIAQRLIRLLCPDCKYEDKAAPQELKDLIAGDMGLTSKEIRIFRGKGCPNCNFTGFFGRTAIYEILLTDETIKDLILKKASSGQIKKIAISKGMQTLRQDGWRKTIAGLTTPEEIINVTSAEEYAVPEPRPRSDLPAEIISSPPPSAFDKRAYPRLEKKVNIRSSIFKSEQDVLKRGFTSAELSVTKDISAGGLVFISREFLPFGSILELTIETPDAEAPIDCLAKVVRTEEAGEEKTYDVAVSFLAISSAERARLNRYVEAKLKEG